MDLADIEAKADEYAQGLIEATGEAKAEYYRTRLEALSYAAQIKSTVAFRKERDNRPMQIGPGSIVPYAGPPPAYIVTGVVEKLRAEVDRCAGLADEEFQAAELWRGNDESRTATKNAGDFRAEVYTEVGQRLEQILREGGLL